MISAIRAMMSSSGCEACGRTCISTHHIGGCGLEDGLSGQRPEDVRGLEL